MEGFTIEAIFYFITLCVFLGVEIISNVPSILHTPLMSGANAIHGVILVGAIIVMQRIPSDDYINLSIGFLAVLFGTLNISGGFFVTGRILAMFSKKKKA
ncbi:MAG: NAD(P) transhydrogenase subunit alpha [Flavobacteriia bacterium]|jgi:NAD(P) transhydrogenase subunit alpha|nr:NAD(P) transhydrogenase subunit alpha [Flavobacteriia bacterium]